MTLLVVLNLINLFTFINQKINKSQRNRKRKRKRKTIPKYPSLHTQVKLPRVFLQIAWS